MGRIMAALLIAISVRSACAAPAGPTEPTGRAGEIGWWTLTREVDPATGKQACVARHVGGGMTLNGASLTIAAVPMRAVLSSGALAIALDGIPLPPPLTEAAGVTRHFGVLTLEGSALAKAVASQKLLVSVGAVDAMHDMRGAREALQWIQDSCQR